MSTNSKEISQDPEHTTAPQPWIVLRFNHFDPTWRRCWDRDFTYGGNRFVSYRTIEERWISEAIATCADGVSCFMVECSWVLRHYLERHPEQLETLRRLAREGRFELLGSGENIVDANMIHGETLVRNLVLGTRWGRETLGVNSSTGWHSDGFGSCAQMPQVFRQCGYDWMPAISYNTPDAPYWRGLDGSVVFFSDTARSPGVAPFSKGERLAHRLAVPGYCYVKFPPCPACKGQGCPDCRGEGFVITNHAEFAPRVHERLPGKAGVMLLWGEEIMPGVNVAKDIASFNTAHPDIAVRQGIYRDLRPFIADFLDKVDCPPPAQISSKVENNPSQSGCYVSRIKIKQQHRELEHALLAAECWDTLFNAGAAQSALRDVWKKMSFSAFHDAITSSHCDPAYDELCDLHRDLGRQIAGIREVACRRVLEAKPDAVTIFNHHSFAASVPVTVTVPAGWKGAEAGMNGQKLPVYDVVKCENGTQITFLSPNVPALGAVTIKLAEPSAPVSAKTGADVLVEEGRVVPCTPAEHKDDGCPAVVRQGPLTLHAGEKGVTGIAVEGLGDVVDPAHFFFGELILEHDVGDPWATRSLDRTRERLSPYTKLAGITRQGDEIRIRYEGKHPACDDPHRTHDPHVTYLTWAQIFRLRLGVPWVEVETRVRWYTQSRRLRLAFPSRTTLHRGVYDVPYGVLERERYEGTTINGGNAGGDWPAVHWAGIQTPHQTFSIFNRGTPSYRVEDGVVMVSVVRSPQIPYGLFEPQCYVAHNYDGMRDHGEHVFRHAFYVAAGHWSENDTARQATLFNSGLSVVPGALKQVLPGWRIEAEHTTLTSVKMAEDGKGIVMRFTECAGKQDALALVPPRPFTQMQCCSLMEESGTVVRPDNGTFKVVIEPWKIVTLRIQA